ncbi:hypothetical protein CWB72_13710 [Pseudoalteromonas phenolica]|uniref:hypothetical protein n=1 Tax=Pseudoalteromonas phenolica TaxID=161398 RepID=UPI00110B0A23|nr:hypothetical protein [Pseudoalteromonas phenolica]TMN88172.1 hypothetical protein CWB72_13710 [Pseudoalteromonas phenolica]
MFFTLFLLNALINFLLIPYIAKKLLIGKYDKVNYLVLLIAVLGTIPLLGAIALLILIICAPRTEQINEQKI